MADLQHALNENLYFLSGIINHISYVPLHNKPYAIVMRANQSSLSVDVSFFFRHKKMVEDNRLGFLPEAISGLVESGGVVLGEVVTGFISLAVMAFRFKLA